MIKLSIIVPVYGVEAFVGKALDSIFETSASTDVFEVIVVNDGTKDRSMDVVRLFSDKPNLRILEQENLGLSAARMKGLSVAKGEYVWFIDSDDYLVEDGVGRVLGQLVQRVGADVLMFPLMWVYEDGTEDYPDYEIKDDNVVLGKTVIRDLGLPVWAAQRYVFKRSLAGNSFLRFPQGLLHEDEYFGPVLMYLAETVCVLKDSVYQYRIRQGSIMASKSARSWYDMVSIHGELIRFLEQDVEPEDNTWFRTFCFKRLLALYYRDSRFYGTPEFVRFARENGFYVWRQWIKACPGRSLKNRLGRLFFFMFPVVRQCVFGND